MGVSHEVLSQGTALAEATEEEPGRGHQPHLPAQEDDNLPGGGTEAFALQVLAEARLLETGHVRPQANLELVEGEARAALGGWEDEADAREEVVESLARRGPLV